MPYGSDGMELREAIVDPAYPFGTRYEGVGEQAANKSRRKRERGQNRRLTANDELLRLEPQEGRSPVREQGGHREAPHHRFPRLKTRAGMDSSVLIRSEDDFRRCLLRGYRLHRRAAWEGLAVDSRALVQLEEPNQLIRYRIVLGADEDAICRGEVDDTSRVAGGDTLWNDLEHVAQLAVYLLIGQLANIVLPIRSEA